MSTVDLSLTREIGHGLSAFGSSDGWPFDPSEWAPELQWPWNIQVYDRMRRTDAGVGGVLRAVTLPIRRTQWRIDPNGARPEVVQQVSQDCGVAVVGDDTPTPSGRVRGKFSFSEHIRLACLYLVYGHMPFEQVYRYDEDANLMHLAKLAPRMPVTIAKIHVDRAGDLLGIDQYPSGVMGDIGVYDKIPVSRLAYYCHDREAGAWQGQSILRSAYKHWLIKDRLIKTSAVSVERNGMGVPIVEQTQPNATPAQIAAANALAQSYRVGESAGGATPYGFRLRLVGVEGHIPDPLPLINYHDQQTATMMLAQFLELGRTAHGSRALGASFIDFFLLALQAFADDLADTFTCDVIEDLVDVNWGTDEQAPKLTAGVIGEDNSLTAESLAALVNAEVIEMDDDLEAFVRDEYKMPVKNKATTRKRVAIAEAVQGPPTGAQVVEGAPPAPTPPAPPEGSQAPPVTAGRGGRPKVRAAKGRWDPKLAKEVEAEHLDAISTALGGLIDVGKAIAAYAKHVKAAADDEESAIDDAVSWMSDNAETDLGPATSALQDMYKHGYVVGDINAVSALGDKSDILLTDWQSAAKLFGADGSGRGLADMLDNAGVVIKSIADNHLDQLGRALGQGIHDGLSPNEITVNLQAILDDPWWADTITVTETNRAMSTAALDRYGIAGIEKKEWQTAAGDTEDECADNEDQGAIALDDAFDSGDDAPPAHPNCRCVVVPVLDSGGDDAE